jgi:hypothetical protein
MTNTVSEALAKFPWRLLLWLTIAVPMAIAAASFAAVGAVPESLLANLESGLNEALRRSDSGALDSRAEVTLILTIGISAAWTVVLGHLVVLSHSLDLGSIRGVSRKAALGLAVLLLPPGVWSWWEDVDDLWHSNAILSWADESAWHRLLMALLVGLKFAPAHSVIFSVSLIVKAVFSSARLGAGGKGAPPAG